MKLFSIENIITGIIFGSIGWLIGDMISQYVFKEKPKQQSQIQEKIQVEENNSESIINENDSDDYENVQVIIAGDYFIVKTISKSEHSGCIYRLFTKPKHQEDDPGYVEIEDDCEKYKVGDSLVLTKQ